LERMLILNWWLEFPISSHFDTRAFKVIFDNKVILEAFGPRILRQGKYFKTE